MHKAVSNYDLIRYCKDVSYQDYNDLDSKMTLNQLFKKKPALALLLRPNGRKDVGHWVFLQRLSPTTIEYMDPLGLDLDDSEMIKAPPILSKILLRNGIKKVIGNDYPLQSQSSSVQTCGRHVALRCHLRKIPLKDYVDLIVEEEIDPDILVTILTSSLTK